MMDRIREGVNSIAVKIILGLIILTFVFAGVGNIGGGNNAAAKVNNTEIGRGAFEQQYTQERNRMQSQMGDYFANLLADPSYVQSFRKSILDRMINEVLLEQYADSMGMRISDEQIRTQILNMQEFQNGGKFDQDIYAATLRRAGYTVESFAAYLRSDLTRQQILSAVQNSEFSLSGEINLQNELMTQTRDIRTILLSIDEYAKNIELDDNELQAYYADNSERFTRPEQAKVSYIELSAQALKNQIDISNEKAEQYYQENLDKYSSAEQRQLSHILVEGDDKAKAQAILDELNAGADFVELAKAKSEDIGSSEEGGSLGLVERDVMDPAFEAAAFALKNEGDVTGLVKSGFGYHIIKLDALKVPQVTPFADVSEEIKVELADQEAVEQFYALQTQLETVAFEYPDSLDDAAEAVNAKIQTTDFISQADAPELLRAPLVMQAILSPEVKEDGLNSEVIEVAPEHVIVVRVEETRDESVLPFADVKEQVVAQLSATKGEQKAMEVANSVVEGLKQNNTAVVGENKLAFGQQESVDRGHPLAQAIFAMVKPTETQATYLQTTDMQGNIVIVALDKVTTNPNPEYDTQIGAQLVRSGSQQDVNAVLKKLREDADIEYFVVNAQP